MSYNNKPQGALTPSTKPAIPLNDPPLLSLPPSLPKQSYIPGGAEDDEDVNALDKRDDFNNPTRVRRPSQWNDAPVARSLTNNDHSLLPGSVSNGGIKMGQSPTILSILSGQDSSGGHSGGMSFQRGGSMVASSRTYVSTTVPQSTQPTTFQMPNPDLYHSTLPDHDEDAELDGLDDDELPFDFTLDE